MPILFAGDEYREAKACMSSILSSDSPVIIGNMTTDGDSNAFKGARDAQLECTGKPMERMADVIHLTKCMRNKIKKANFTLQMFKSCSQKEHKFLQGRLAKDLSHRVLVELKCIPSRATCDNKNNSLFKKCAKLKNAIVDCYSGKCGKSCERYSWVCKGQKSKDCWKKDFLPPNKSSFYIKGEDRKLLLQCLNIRLSKIAVRQTRASATTNKLEALHRAINVSNPKDVTFRRNAKARKLSAAARLNDGHANSAIEKAAAVGAPFHPNAKVLRSLKRLQENSEYDKRRQDTAKYRSSRYRRKIEKYKKYDSKRNSTVTYSTDILNK